MKLPSIRALFMCSVFIFLGSSLHAQTIYKKPGMVDFIKTFHLIFLSIQNKLSAMKMRRTSAQ